MEQIEETYMSKSKFEGNIFLVSHFIIIVMVNSLINKLYTNALS